MAWRLAGSLAQLRREINELAPERSRLSDGTLGDPAHASRASRHNPNKAGVVTALDITHDPKAGVDIHAIARRIVQSPHPNLEYVISNGEVAKRKTGFRWEKYRGANPHSKHAHFAVGRGPDSAPGPPYDDVTSWLTQEDDMPNLDEIRAVIAEEVAKVLRTEGVSGGVADIAKQVAGNDAPVPYNLRKIAKSEAIGLTDSDLKRV